MRWLTCQETTLPFGKGQLSHAGPEALQWGRTLLALPLIFSPNFLLLFIAQESAVLAIWLKGLTVAIAGQDPSDKHAALLGLQPGTIMTIIWFISCTKAEGGSLRQSCGNEGLHGQKMQLEQIAAGPAEPAHPERCKLSVSLCPQWCFACILSRNGVLKIALQLFLWFLNSLGLAQEAISTGKLLWKIRPKLHKFSSCNLICYVNEFGMFCERFLRLDHIVLDQAQFLCPLQGSNYNDEDMMGNIKTLAAASTPVRLGYQVLERYSAYLCCRWMRREE